MTKVEFQVLETRYESRKVVQVYKKEHKTSKLIFYLIGGRSRLYLTILSLPSTCTVKDKSLPF